MVVVEGKSTDEDDGPKKIRQSVFGASQHGLVSVLFRGKSEDVDGIAVLPCMVRVCCVRFDLLCASGCPALPAL